MCHLGGNPTAVGTTWENGLELFFPGEDLCIFYEVKHLHVQNDQIFNLGRVTPMGLKS